MKKILVLLLAASAVGGALAQPSVGVSIGINQPGVYGRINLGNLPGEALLAPQPVVIAPPRVVLNRQPIYLYVSPFEQQNWGRYCHRYAACGQPVYFVRDDWVRERYMHEHPGWDRYHRGGPPGFRDDHRRDGGRGFDRDHGRDDGHHDDGHRGGPDRRN